MRKLLGWLRGLPARFVQTCRNIVTFVKGAWRWSSGFRLTAYATLIAIGMMWLGSWMTLPALVRLVFLAAGLFGMMLSIIALWTLIYELIQLAMFRWHLKEMFAEEDATRRTKRASKQGANASSDHDNEVVVAEVV